MGRYMKKSKLSADVAVMEVPRPPHAATTDTYSGVLTRARTLALQSASLCYLQLRSRRLEKPSPPSKAAKPTADCSTIQRKKQNSKSEMEEEEEGHFGNKGQVLGFICGDDGSDDMEASFGDNCMDFDVKDRSTRESTPCSLIRDTSNIQTPGSTTRQRSYVGTNPRIQSSRQRSMPMTHEMEEFFTYAEQQQQNLFTEKYNFDFMNDVPLTGRYEWVQVIP